MPEVKPSAATLSLLEDLFEVVDRELPQVSVADRYRGELLVVHDQLRRLKELAGLKFS